MTILMHVETLRASGRAVDIALDIACEFIDERVNERGHALRVLLRLVQVQRSSRPEIAECMVFALFGLDHHDVCHITKHRSRIPLRQEQPDRQECHEDQKYGDKNGLVSGEPLWSSHSVTHELNLSSRHVRLLSS